MTFLCCYLASEELCLEINDGLNVVESWNIANNFISYGKGERLPRTGVRIRRWPTLPASSPVQSSLVFVNTLMIQRVLTYPTWTKPMEIRHLDALTPLPYHYINPYGFFELDMGILQQTQAQLLDTW